MNVIFHYNVTIDFISLVLITVLMYGKSKIGKKDYGDNLFNKMALSLLFIFLVDIPAWVFNGIIIPGAQLALWVLDTAYYILQVVFCYYWLLYSVHYTTSSETRVRKIALPVSIPLIAEIGMIITNIWTNSVFSIDELGNYERGPLYMLNLVPFVIYIIGAVAVTIEKLVKTKEPVEKRKFSLLLVFMVLPIAALVLNSLYYGLALLWPCCALLLLMIYISSQNQILVEEQLETARETKKAAELKEELTDSRVLLMLSQIQPHFMFNSLAVIQELCHTNPALAEKATMNFSRFLRGNIDSISTTRLIPFPQELEHTQNYIELEKLRFQTRLNVVYDIKSKAFDVPTLTLQPIVENAIRYGLMKKEYGGTVMIATREDRLEYTISVSDDGVGFDPDAILPKEGEHIGLNNVRTRISKLCDGTIKVESKIGEGTSVEIHIPKGERKCK